MINRRDFLGLSLSAGASLTISPQLLRAFQQPRAKLIQKAIPSTGEMLPAVGLSFSNHPSCADLAALKEVLKTFADGDGRLYDVMHVNTSSENFHINSANELGITNKLFWSVRAAPPGPPSQADAALVNSHISSLLSRTKLPRLDLALLPVASDPALRAALIEEKKAGRVRYIGVQTIVANNQYEQAAAIMRNEPIDFIGIDYDIGNRARVEEVILPLAQERKIAVIAYFPYGNAGGVSCAGGTSLFSRVANTPVPAWAAEFDATTWAQFFTKYVISHPAVTAARVGTTKPHHMVDNLGGGVGRLPDEATRKRMAALIDALPPASPPAPPPNPAQAPGIALSAAILDRYVGSYKAESGFTATFRREGATLFVKPGPNPEAPLNARSETRLQDPRGPVFEFLLDAQGKVTGAVLEQQGPQGTQKIPLTRQ